jgi:hypothetical protein
MYATEKSRIIPTSRLIQLSKAFSTLKAFTHNQLRFNIFLDRHLQLFKIPEISEYGTCYAYRDLPNGAASAI